MKVNEIERKLGINRANIRYYEKEGLIHPKREANGYRDYSDEDIETLKKVLVLRKMGISVDSARKILGGDISLQEATKKCRHDLETQIEELRGAISLCDEIVRKNDSIDEIDVDFMLDKIHTEEAHGSHFASIVNDLIDFEANSMGIYIGEKTDALGKKLRNAVLFILLLGIAIGLLWEALNWGPFWKYFFNPISVIAMLAIIYGIVFFIGRKNPRAGEIALKAVRIVAGIIFAVILVLLVIVLLNSRLHFWF